MPTKSLILAPALPADFKITILPDLEEKKEKLLTRALAYQAILDIGVRDKAIAAASDIASHLRLIEDSRVEVKAPFFKTGQAIDKAARDHITKLEAEKKRLDRLIGAFEAEQERKREEVAAKLRAEAAEREAEAERKRREAAAAAADTAKSGAPVSDALAAALDAENAEDEAATARRLEEDRQIKLAEEQRKQAAAGGARRFEVEVEIIDIKALYAAQPLCVKLVPDLVMIKGLNERGVELPGVKITKRPIFSTRAK